MPEDYQAILSDLGVDTSQEPATLADSTPAEPDAQSNQSVTPQANDSQTPDANQGENNQATSGDNRDDETRRRNEAFAAMRSENTRYKQFIQHLMKGANFNGKEEDFIKSLTEAAYQNQAKNNQVSPEMLKRLDALESQNKSLADAANRQTFAANIKHLQETFKLNDSEVKEFVDLAVKEHINLLEPHTDFVMLYQGIFHNKLQEKAVEAARQEWIKQSNKANNAATPDGKSGTKNPEPTNVNTMAEFDSLLQSIPKNK